MAPRITADCELKFNDGESKDLVSSLKYWSRQDGVCSIARHRKLLVHSAETVITFESPGASPGAIP